MSRNLRSLLVLLVGGVALVFAADMLTAMPGYRVPKDFPEYYAAGRLNLRGENPYDPVLLLEEQRKYQPERDDALMMWNPPPALALYMPLALLPFRLAALAWVGLQLLATLFACDLLWRHYSDTRQSGISGIGHIGYRENTEVANKLPNTRHPTPDTRHPRTGSVYCRWLAPVVGFLFVGTWWMVAYGQNTGFLLLGLAGFLHFTKRERPLSAGACAALTALKPHLLAGFGVLLLADLASRRGRLVVLAGGSVIAVSLGLALLANPHAIEQYLAATRNPGPGAIALKDWAVPMPAYAVRMALDPDRFGLQFLPCLLGCACLLVWRMRWGQRWDWGTAPPMVVAVAVLTAPYGWIFDLTVLLAPVLFAMSRVAAAGRWSLFTVLVLGQVAVIVVSLATAGALQNYWWVAPAVLALSAAALIAAKITIYCRSWRGSRFLPTKPKINENVN